ncbi:MAG TPA: hypothetical protein VMS31_14325 [Pyrinomonadaceae bacterium]|nr:hypothetical protein [Pyrinomonadaceae bacterium]
MTSRNLLSAVFISVHLSVFLVLVYVFFPILSLIVSGFFRAFFSSGPQTGGVAMVGGGASNLLLKILIVEPILFLLVFVLLQRRTKSRLSAGGK